MTRADGPPVCAGACSGRAQLRAFLRLERRVYASRPPARFADAEDACRRALRAGGVCLLATRAGEPAARAVVTPRGDTAFFSLFAALPDEAAARSLVEAMRSFAAEKGCSRLLGPVPPDGSGFGAGVRLPGGEAGEGGPWYAQNPPWYADTLAACGLREESRLLALRRPLGRNPFAGAARWAAGRGVAADVAPLGRRSTLEAARAVCEDARAAGPEAFARVYGRVAALAPRAVAVLARAGADAAPAGWALCAPEGRVFRVLQLQVLPRWRGTPCAAAILDTAWQEAARRGARELAVGTIDSANPHSLPMARNAGFRVCAAWAVYAAGVR